MVGATGPDPAVACPAGTPRSVPGTGRGGLTVHSSRAMLVAMLPSLIQPLNQDDLLRLDAFLHSAACGREAMGLSYAHGFLTAAASGPEDLEPGEWLRLVFDDPVFDTGEQAEAVLGLALRLYREIQAGLAAPGGYRPVLEFLRDGRGGMLADAGAWCRGYEAGMSLCGEQWSGRGDPGLPGLLAPIHHLAAYQGSRMDTRYQDACGQLPGLAELLFHYWHPRPERSAA